MQPLDFAIFSYCAEVIRILYKRLDYQNKASVTEIRGRSQTTFTRRGK
jgi:hypothetical protein